MWQWEWQGVIKGARRREVGEGGWLRPGERAASLTGQQHGGGAFPASLPPYLTQPSTHLNRTSAGKPNTGSMLASSHRLVSGSPGYPLPKAVVS
jgi:hypothetical protein